MESRPSTPSPLTYVKARCHCGLNELRAAFPTSALPIYTDLCHCSSCRHSSGQSAVCQVNAASLLSTDTDAPFRLDPTGSGRGDGDLTAYQTSRDAVRYFCSVCSAHLVFQYLGKVIEGTGGEREGGYVCVAVGALERTKGIVQPGYHAYLQDTLDGGMADHLRRIGGVDLPRYSAGVGSEQLPLGWRHEALSLKSITPGHMDNHLYLSCHCKSVQFSITRPSPISAYPHAAYPDLLYPYDTTRLSKIRNSHDQKWWLRPLGSRNPTQYLAGYCACEYCRLTSGFEIQPWAYVPLENIIGRNGERFTLFEPAKDDLANLRTTVNKLGLTTVRLPDPDPITYREKLAGLKQYISSPGRYREFCGKCGATVFAWQAGRPDLICVAVSLVDEERNGARAESWFDWWMDRVGFAEQAMSPMTIAGLVEGLRTLKQEQAEEDKKPKILLPPLVRSGSTLTEGNREGNVASNVPKLVAVLSAS